MSPALFPAVPPDEQQAMALIYAQGQPWTMPSYMLLLLRHISHDFA